MAADSIVVATRNPGKLVELRELLAFPGRTLVDLVTAGVEYAEAEDAVENRDTFEENALAKARYFFAQTGGRPVIADDSGLCVTALGGAPGVRSRRYAGATGSDDSVSAANSQRLLEALDGVTDRGAEFVCAIAYVDGRNTHVTVGRTSGSILLAPVGTAGFGYDPLFWSDELRMSFGTASMAAKARVSHRARAADALLRRVRGQAGVDSVRW